MLRILNKTKWHYIAWLSTTLTLCSFIKIRLGLNVKNWGSGCVANVVVCWQQRQVHSEHAMLQDSLNVQMAGVYQF